MNIIFVNDITNVLKYIKKIEPNLITIVPRVLEKVYCKIKSQVEEKPKMRVQVVEQIEETPKVVEVKKQVEPTSSVIILPCVLNGATICLAQMEWPCLFKHSHIVKSKSNRCII